MSVNSSVILISNQQRSEKINVRLLQKMVEAILAELEIHHAQLEINLVRQREMADVNWRFLHHEGSTDVLTFNYSSSKFTIKNSKLKLHGELFICVDEAILHSKKFKTSWQSEIVRYIVHGILHLMGHDDSKERLRRKMKRAENFLLRKLSKKFSLAQISGNSKLRA